MNIDYSMPTYLKYGPEDTGWSYGNPFDFSTLRWDLPIDPPDQLDLALASVEYYYNDEINKWKQQRDSAYPTYADQLDQIYHEGVDAWKSTIQSVKDAYPKQTFDADELERRKQEVRDFLAG